jgi:thioester reductase-like protein
VLHHVATAGIFCSDTYRKKDVVYETEVPASSRGIVFGYGQAKWGAEQIVRAAMARGLEAVIHRPGLIAGDTERGFWSERDLMTHLLRFELRNKSVAEYQRPFDGLPVDTMSRFLARCGTEGGFGGQTFHLVHPDPIAIETWLNAALGDTQVETRAFDVWHAELTQYFETEKGEVASFLPVFSHTIRGTNELLLDFFNHLPRFDFVRFRAAAEHCAVKIPDHKALAEGGWLESLT